jgi:hypothetical protein
VPSLDAPEPRLESVPSARPSSAAVRYELPPGMVMIETAPEKRQPTIEAAAEDETHQPRRPPRPVEPADIAPVPLVQIETRK